MVCCEWVDLGCGPFRTVPRTRRISTHHLPTVAALPLRPTSSVPPGPNSSACLPTWRTVWFMSSESRPPRGYKPVGVRLRRADPHGPWAATLWAVDMDCPVPSRGDAECLADPSHIPPVEGCGCGWRVFFDRERIVSLVLARRWALTHGSFVAASTLWGSVTEGETGAVGSAGRVDHIWAPPCLCGGRAVAVRPVDPLTFSFRRPLARALRWLRLWVRRPDLLGWFPTYPVCRRHADPLAVPLGELSQLLGVPVSPLP